MTPKERFFRTINYQEVDRPDVGQWMALDLEYIDSWSPSLDLKILLKTIPAVLSTRGAA